MCSCQNKISGMKKVNFGKVAMEYAAGLAGMVAAQEGGKMVPATTLDPMYTDIAKVAIGVLGVPMLTKNTTIQQVGLGFALQGGLNLVNQYLLSPAAPGAVAGYDNAGYAIMGSDNRDYALMGTGGSQPSVSKSLANYAM